MTVIPEGLKPLSEKKLRPRNEILSWETLNSVGTQSTITQGHQKKARSILGFTSSLPTRAFYIIFKLLFEGAKFLTRNISGIRERFRS
jgi:hypothetical protein